MNRRPTYTARSTVDLLAMTPYLLGFHPQESLVVLTFGAPHGCFHARVDLPRQPGDREQVVDSVIRALTHHRVPATALLVHSRDASASRALCAELVDRVLEAGIAVVDVARADGRRWYPFPEEEGEGTAYDLTTHPFTVERVFHGDVVLGSRDELATSLASTHDEATEAAAYEYVERIVAAAGAAPASAGALLRAEARWVQRRIRRRLRDHRPLSAADAGRLLALMTMVPVRDVAWSEMTRATAREQMEMWRDLVRRCPSELLAPAASLLAFAAWLAGDGALAWCALDRAAEVDRSYSMAQCIAGCLEGAVPPTTWTPVPEGELAVFAEEP